MCMDKVKDWLFGEEEGYTEEDIRKIFSRKIYKTLNYT